MTETAELQTQAATPQPEPQTDAPQGAEAVAAQIGWIETEGAFVLPFGAGLRLGAEVLGDGSAATEIALDKVPRLPGLLIEEAAFDPLSQSAMVSITGKTAVPLTEESAFTLNFGRTGTPSEFNVRSKILLDWMGQPDLALSWTPDGGLVTTVTVAASQFVPEALSAVAQAQGDVVLTLTDGKLSGALDTEVTLPNLMRTRLSGAWNAEGLAATVDLVSMAPWLGDVSGQGAITAAGQISARLDKPAGELPATIPGLSFNGGMMSVFLNPDGTLGGGFTDLAMDYRGIATTTASFMVDGGQLTGRADLAMQIPGLSEATGHIAMVDGKLSGGFQLGKDNFPEGLPLKSGTISGEISETGALSFSGQVGIGLGPAGEGQLQASYSEAGGLAIGATMSLDVPGLQTANFTIGLNGDDITGEGEIAVDPALLSGIEGSVTITYAEGRWAGETTLGFEADDGKLQGNITVRVRQAEDDSLKVGGEGDVTVQIAPRLAGTLRATILEEGGIDVSGEIAVTEPLEMFPEQRFEKELLNIQTNIPLWAILVAVLRVRAGVRAGIGPGVFRDIRVTGSYTIGQEGEPSFAITGEMYIPAFVEGYAGFGAGLGASVLLGSLTGGIEAMGTAGIYGAISVIPELAYADGDYSIEGLATMAAGARLKLSLNAWAEIEALWVTVWDNTWELASVTMPIGPDLGLSAQMNYTFGSPEPPSLEFNSSDIDTDSLIEGAMPKDGPPSAGVRDAVRNEARWQGAQRAAGPAADSVPSELADQANAQETVPTPAGGSAPNGPGAAPEGAVPNGNPTEGEQATDASGAPVDLAAAEQQQRDAATPDPAAAGTVTDTEAADSTEPRHGQVTLAMLQEPPVPMPRTKAQQVADVEAAAALVRLIVQSGETTDTLDNYFPAIKRRFALGVVDFEVSGGGLAVVVAVNHSETVNIGNEEVQRLSHALIRANPRLATKVRYDTTDKSFSAGGVSVTQGGMGVHMIADPLTPLHDQGSGPKASALGDLFKELATAGPTGTQSYIKGHLLNDNLGGPGEGENLFPITQTANTRHSAEIEELAKKLVNDDHYFVRYEVSMTQNGDAIAYPDPSDATGRTKKLAINSTITAKLDVLNADMQTPRHVKTAIIPSNFDIPQAGRAAQSAELYNATRRELLDPAAYNKSFSVADGAAELAGRDAANSAFLDRDENQVGGAADTSLIDQLNAGTDADAGRQADLDQSEVLLSSARSSSARTIVLDTDVQTALGKLSHANTLLGGADALFSGSRTLSKRLSDAGIGTSNTAGLIAAAMPALQAARIDSDIEKSGLAAAQKDVINQVNNATSAAKISATMSTFLSEAAAFDKVSARPKLDDVNAIASLLDSSGATAADKDAMASQLAHTLGDRAVARAYLQDTLGIWSSTNWFHTKLRTQVNKL